VVSQQRVGVGSGPADNTCQIVDGCWRNGQFFRQEVKSMAVRAMEHSFHQVYDGFQVHDNSGSQEGLEVDSAHCLDLWMTNNLLLLTK